MAGGGGGGRPPRSGGGSSAADGGGGGAGRDLGRTVLLGRIPPKAAKVPETGSLEGGVSPLARAAGTEGGTRLAALVLAFWSLGFAFDLARKKPRGRSLFSAVRTIFRSCSTSRSDIGSP